MHRLTGKLEMYLMHGLPYRCTAFCLIGGHDAAERYQVQPHTNILRRSILASTRLNAGVAQSFSDLEDFPFLTPSSRITKCS